MISSDEEIRQLNLSNGNVIFNSNKQYVIDKFNDLNLDVPENKLIEIMYHPVILFHTDCHKFIFAGDDIENEDIIDTIHIVLINMSKPTHYDNIKYINLFNERLSKYKKQLDQ